MSAVPPNDSPLSKRVQQAEATDGVKTPANGSVLGDAVGRTASTSSTKVDPVTIPSRSGTLKKNSSFRKRSSLSRRGSLKSMRSIRGAAGDGDDEGFNSVFQIPIPTQGNPTEVLANRFQAWRKLLKDLITYFREIQASYEQRSKATIKVANVINNTQSPNIFLTQGGLDDALTTLRGFHKISLTEANKSRDIEDDVITQLNGLRSDLNQKIKEIKSLSGDFKNSVDKERENTRKAVEKYKEALANSDIEPSAASGRGDPFIVRLAVDRQVEKQIEEENYLHRAYLNLEGSGRELESIVVGEIQKAYNAYVGILRRETDHAHETIDDLRAGPIAMPKDQEWIHFVENDEHFVNPNIPLRRLEDIYYPGKYNPAATEIRGGMLERKSKYLKSYTPGWYVLSPTHLHEFKSADHIHTQQPVMSLYLLDQKLGSHSQPGASSHKFSLKGSQTGGMHRGHSWVFRAESYDTMMAWFEDIRALTEKTGAERNAFVRRHARSVSGDSQRRPSVSSDGLGEDDADTAPYAANAARQDTLTPPPKRPSPGGRFPSDINVNRERLQAPLSPSSGSSDWRDDQLTAIAASPVAAVPVLQSPSAGRDAVHSDPKPAQQIPFSSTESPAVTKAPTSLPHQSLFQPSGTGDGTTDYVPALAAVGGAAAGATAVSASTKQGQNAPAPAAATTETQPITDTLSPAQAPPDTREPALPIIDGEYAHTQKPSSFLAPTQPQTDASSIATTTPGEEIPEAGELPAGLHRTGEMFPAVIRHDTSVSVSKLHVPGGFPPTPASE